MSSRLSMVIAVSLLLCVFGVSGDARQTTTKKLPSNLFGPPPASLDQAQTSPVQPAPRRLVYYPVGIKAAALAELLNKHFKDDAVITVVSEPANQECVVISAKTPSAYQDVLVTLARLDRQSAQLTIEVMLIELTAEKDNKDKPAVDLKAFTGPTEGVNKYVGTLQTKGGVTSLRRITLSTMPYHATSVLVGQSKPYITGIVKAAPAGNTVRTIQYRDIGTKVNVTPTLGPDNRITLELNIQDSQAVQPSNGIPIGLDEQGAPIMATQFTNSTFTPSVTLKSGHTILANETDWNSNAGGLQTLIVVSARLQDAAK